MTLSNNLILGLNIQCLRYHKDELQIFLKSLPSLPQVLAFAETWVSEEDDLYDYNIDGYQPIESKHRHNVKRRSGAVAIYVKNGIEFSPIAFDTDIECKILEIKISDDDVKLVCVVYRPETMILNQFFPFCISSTLSFMNR